MVAAIKVRMPVALAAVARAMPVPSPVLTLHDLEMIMQCNFWRDVFCDYFVKEQKGKQRKSSKGNRSDPKLSTWMYLGSERI